MPSHITTHEMSAHQRNHGCLSLYNYTINARYTPRITAQFLLTFSWKQQPPSNMCKHGLHMFVVPMCHIRVT